MTDINVIDNNEYEPVDFTESAEMTDESASTRTFTRMEKLYTVAAAVLGFGFVKLQLFMPKGILTTVLDILVIAAAAVFLRRKNREISGINKVIMIVLLAFSLVFSLTDNGFIKSLDSIFIVMGLGYFVYSAANGLKDIADFFPLTMKHAVLKAPRSVKGAYGEAVSSAARDSRVLSTVKLVALGLVITVPITAVVAALLISADSGMESVFAEISQFMPHIINVRTFWNIVLAIPCALYFYGMLYANTHPEECEPLSEDACRFALMKRRAVPNLAAYTAVTPVLLLYVMFFISQAAYFLSAFTGNLPEGYSYAAYARRGFFELCAITVINLALIIFLSVYTKKCGENKPAALKFYTVSLSVSTLILIAVALSKMVMYISVYGLTRLRLYTTWFMVLCAIVFLLITVKQFRTKMKLSGKVVKVFTVMFALLCFGCPDGVISAYNISMYRAGHLRQLDMEEITKLSADGRLAAIILLADDDDMSCYKALYRNGEGLNVPSIVLNELYR